MSSEKEPYLNQVDWQIIVFTVLTVVGIASAVPTKIVADRYMVGSSNHVVVASAPAAEVSDPE